MKEQAQIENKRVNMKDKDIVNSLALSRGSMMDEKRAILKKHFPRASPGFLHSTSLYYTILILIYIHSNCSLLRIYEHTRIKNKIAINILIQFGFLICDNSRVKHKYNITPLTRLIISDLLAVYKTNLNTFHALNLEDKKADYLEIRAKIKEFKKK